jgi:hypothetical protein
MIFRFEGLRTETHRRFAAGKAYSENQNRVADDEMLEAGVDAAGPVHDARPRGGDIRAAGRRPPQA